MNAPREKAPSALRIILLKSILVFSLAALICPAVIHITSPWWAKKAVRWVAKRYWTTDIDFAMAAMNPFTGIIDCSGGTFKGPGENVFQVEGSVSRFQLKYDLVSLVFNHRIQQITFDISSITVIFPEGGIPATISKFPRDDPKPSISPALSVLTVRGKRIWRVNRLTLRIDRGILHSSEHNRHRVTSMDLNFESSYENVSDVHELAGMIMRDIFSAKKVDEVVKSRKMGTMAG